MGFYKNANERITQYHEAGIKFGIIIGVVAGIVFSVIINLIF